ncbi:tetratricopeptide repeat protein [Rhodocaloribacter litoris]|uniref:tetratricopeptide repeat protein n=1 Tax=Rhodocaloribacter litoris TaxID=2558931 RepID=UPI00141F576A|nr:tetratricopeptide repeat protein [Rhodocaloribacter litoris]QXD15896.1 tetratricopeptide repeat protein [Rhodocaloribacter litoris]
MKRLLLAFLLLMPALDAAAPPEPVLQAARLALADGAYEAAVDTLETVAARTPLSAEGYRLLGLAQEQLLRYDRAVEALRQADTTKARVLAALGRNLSRLGRTREALSAYRRAHARDTTDRSIAGNLAALLAEAGRPQEARVLYHRLLAREPGNATLHARLAGLYRMLDSTDQAIIHYEWARRLQPRSLPAWLGLMQVYAKTERLESARRVADAAVEALPEEPVLWQRRGEVALRREELADAQASFERAVALGDTSALTLRNLGAVHYLRNHLPEADSVLTRAFAADSLDGMTAFYLGMTKQYRQDHDSALHFLRRAADLLGRTTLADVYAQLAATYDQMDRDDEAIRTYRLVNALAPERPEVLFHLAALYDAYYADPTTALRQYEAFLERVQPGALPQMEHYARQRVTEIRERLFFEQGRPPAPSPAAGDTSGTRER